MTAKQIIEAADKEAERGTYEWSALVEHEICAPTDPSDPIRQSLRREIRALLAQEGAAKASEPAGGPDVGTLGSCARCGVLWATGVVRCGSLCAICKAAVTEWLNKPEVGTGDL